MQNNSPRMIISQLRHQSMPGRWLFFPMISFLGLMISLCFLQGCASSGAARGASSEADQAYLQTDYQLTHPSGTLRDTYQNSSQRAKGVAIGGVVGAVAGSATSLGTLPGLGVGAIFGGAIGAYIDSHTTLSDKLINRGVQVIMLGDHLLIIIPSFVIFEEKSATLLPDSYGTLDLVAQYISGYPNMSIKISAYTSAVEPEMVNRNLSEQQAAKIMKYLWNRGINTRVLSAFGYGGTKLVTANTPHWACDNYRIEITLEKLYL